MLRRDRENALVPTAILSSNRTEEKGIDIGGGLDEPPAQA